MTDAFLASGAVLRSGASWLLLFMPTLSMPRGFRQDACAPDQATFSNLAGSAPQTGQVSLIGPSWVKPHTGQT